MVRDGHPNKVIARRLGISERTVKAHLTSIFARLGVADRTQAALWAQRRADPRRGHSAGRGTSTKGRLGSTASARQTGSVDPTAGRAGRATPTSADGRSSGRRDRRAGRPGALAGCGCCGGSDCAGRRRRGRRRARR